MKIKHVQKTTLIDYPGEVACSIFLFGCNFRCGFCHNPELVINEETPDIPIHEILEFLKQRKKYLDGVCITGGEPLMTLDLDFLKKIKDLEYKIKIDTNGAYPDKLKEIIDKGLVDFISMDIKSDLQRYDEITNSKVNINNIRQSIEIIHNSGIAYEFRTTILQDFHNREYFKKMLEEMLEITQEKIKEFVLQGFKKQEKMIDVKKYSNNSNTAEKYLQELKNIANHYCDNVEIRV